VKSESRRVKRLKTLELEGIGEVKKIVLDMFSWIVVFCIPTLVQFLIIREV